jgi:hypothetical protein
MAGKYSRTVKAALSETASKFALAEALVLDIPMEGRGWDRSREQSSINDRLEEARQKIIDAGGEPKSVSTLYNYRQVADWVAWSGSTKFRWILDVSFSTHLEACRFGLTYGQFTAMPVKTTEEVRKLAHRLHGESEPEPEEDDWDDQPEPDDEPEPEDRERRDRRRDRPEPEPDPEERRRRRPPPTPYGIPVLIGSVVQDLKAAEGKLAEKGMDAFDLFDTTPDGKLEDLLDSLDRALARQEDRIPRIRALLNEIRTDKVGLRRYAKEKAEAEEKIASQEEQCSSM